MAQELLPESLIEPCIDTLKETTADEKELIRIGVEIINELRDLGSANEANEQFVSIRLLCFFNLQVVLKGECYAHRHEARALV